MYHILMDFRAPEPGIPRVPYSDPSYTSPEHKHDASVATMSAPDIAGHGEHWVHPGQILAVAYTSPIRR